MAVWTHDSYIHKYMLNYLNNYRVWVPLSQTYICFMCVEFNDGLWIWFWLNWRQVSLNVLVLALEHGKENHGNWLVPETIKISIRNISWLRCKHYQVTMVLTSWILLSSSYHGFTVRICPLVHHGSDNSLTIVSPFSFCAGPTTDRGLTTLRPTQLRPIVSMIYDWPLSCLCSSR